MRIKTVRLNDGTIAHVLARDRDGAMVAVYKTAVPPCCVRATPRGGRVLRPCPGHERLCR